eukprot:6208040-Pleurochrysis_carterae.AAC.5
MSYEAILHAQRREEVPLISRGTGQVIFKCLEPAQHGMQPVSGFTSRPTMAHRPPNDGRISNVVVYRQMCASLRLPQHCKHRPVGLALYGRLN